MFGNETNTRYRLSGWIILAAYCLVATAVGADKLVTGPETEKRFPPLKIPEGFRATLFACDPLVEYPSVIAIGPRTGTLFVAYDYMTGLGLEIIRRDEVRVVRDTDGDGYADATTVYADGFNSIQGLAYHAGNVYVMHAPYLTRLKDTNGDDVADERLDLLRGLGLPPEENSNRLHCANGVVVGHDGWLYLALGDRGCDVRRPEGDRLLVQEGGIFRCRSDGRDLHIFSRGLRNIYDVALDEELNVFVRDNENDGGDYMIRVCHCFHGSDHGYPYLYIERPEEAMPPLADLGRGSSAGGTAYLEAAFPAEYRDSLYYCEWGRAVVRYQRQRVESGFAPMQEVDFAAGPPDDPYGFKPTDLVVDRDGSLLVSDWCDGQRPKRGRGRIYRITAAGAEKPSDDPNAKFAGADFQELMGGLNSSRYHVRVGAQEAIEQRGGAGVQSLQQALQHGKVDVLGRLHAVWVLAHVGGHEAIDDLFRLAEHDPDARVRAQAVRALADLTDPILTSHRVDAGRGDEQVCRRLAQIADGADSRVRLEVVVALGRLRWSEAPSWIGRTWAKADPALTHAGMMLLRRCENWPGVLRLLDESPDWNAASRSDVRTMALRAVANQGHGAIADGLLQRLEQESDPRRRREFLDLLARIYKRPPEWTYWGFRPAPRPANTVVWEKTVAIEAALDRALGDLESTVRTLAIRRMLREEIPIRLESLATWLKQETKPEGVAAILDALSARPVAEVRSLLQEIIRNRSYGDEHRLRALAKFVTELDATSEPRLLEIAASLDEGPVLAEVLREFGRRPKLGGSQFLLARLDSRNDDVRAAAVASLADQPVDAAAPHVDRLLRDPDIRVRRAAVTLSGKLNLRDTADLLLTYAGDADLPLQTASLESLRVFHEPRAIPSAVRALQFQETQLAALSYLADLGGPQHLAAVITTAEKSRSIDVLAAVARTMTNWQRKTEPKSEEWERIERAAAALQGSSGALLRWNVRGPLSADVAGKILEAVTAPNQSDAAPFAANDWQEMIVHGTDAQIHLKAAGAGALDSVWLAVSELDLGQAETVEFLASANGTFAVWLNGHSIFTRDKAAAYQPDSDRFSVALPMGRSRIAARVSGSGDGIPFHLRFRHKSSQADHERLTQLALTGRGNVQRGRELFLNAEKSQCVKCHRIADQGGRIGPDLAAIGSRFSRVHLIESILEPSRTVAPSYETWVLVLDSGRLLAGVKVSETATQLTLGDNQGQTHQVPKSTIEESQVQPTSSMPDDVHKRLTDAEFVDLVEFLLSLTKTTK